SYVAQTLKSGKYHHDGAFAFFNDYDGSPKLRAAMSQLVSKWSADWRKTSTITDATALVREAVSLSTASVVPEFSGELVGTAQQTAMRGNLPDALRIAKLAVSLYPDSDGANGILG